MHHYHVFQTSLGFCALAWNDSGLIRFQLPTDNPENTLRHLQRRLPAGLSVAPAATPLPELPDRAIDAARRYFDGAPVEFSELPLDLSEQNESFRRIYAATRQVRWGQTVTYGLLARELGTGPETARDVGQAMAHNPIPLIIPCHRVLAAGGKLGGFSAPGGTRTKLRMLELEGFHIRPTASPQQSLL